jgi:hypothetical protein
MVIIIVYMHMRADLKKYWERGGRDIWRDILVSDHHLWYGVDR